MQQQRSSCYMIALFFACTLATVLATPIPEAANASENPDHHPTVKAHAEDGATEVPVARVSFRVEPESRVSFRVEDEADYEETAAPEDSNHTVANGSHSETEAPVAANHSEAAKGDYAETEAPVASDHSGVAVNCPPCSVNCSDAAKTQAPHGADHTKHGAGKLHPVTGGVESEKVADEKDYEDSSFRIEDKGVTVSAEKACKGCTFVPGAAKDHVAHTGDTKAPVDGTHKPEEPAAEEDYEEEEKSEPEVETETEHEAEGTHKPEVKEHAATEASARHVSFRIEDED